VKPVDQNRFGGFDGDCLAACTCDRCDDHGYVVCRTCDGEGVSPVGMHCSTCGDDEQPIEHTDEGPICDTCKAPLDPCPTCADYVCGRERCECNGGAP